MECLLDYRFIFHSLEDPDVLKIAIAVTAGIVLFCLIVLSIGLFFLAAELILRGIYLCYAWCHHRIVKGYRAYRFSKSEFPSALAAKFKEALDQYGPDAETEFRIYHDHYTVTHDGEVDVVPYYSLGFVAMAYWLDIRLCCDAVLPLLGPGFVSGYTFETISSKTLSRPVLTHMEHIRGAYVAHALIARTTGQNLQYII